MGIRDYGKALMITTAEVFIIIIFTGHAKCNLTGAFNGLAVGLVSDRKKSARFVGSADREVVRRFPPMFSGPGVNFGYVVFPQANARGAITPEVYGGP